MRKLLPYTSIAVVIAALYTGWVLLSRHSANQAIEHAAEQREVDTDRKVINRLGGDELKILNFYASPANPRRGEKVLICYGVANAKEVKIDPPVEALHPALSYCMETKAVKDTEYKLTASDAAGHSTSQSFELQLAH